MHNPLAADAPAAQDVLDALDDEDCRRIISCLRRRDEPMAARDVAEACDIPSSTLYRKLDALSDASLLEERTEIRPDGHHTTTYVLGFDAVTLEVGSDGALEAEIDRPDSPPGERLSDLWTEVRKET